MKVPKGQGIGLNAGLSFFLLVMTALGFVVVRQAEHDQLAMAGLSGALLLANEMRHAFHEGPQAVKRVVEEFGVEGISGATLVGPRGFIIASSKGYKPGAEEEFERLKDAAESGEVQAGFEWTEEGRRFRVYVPFARLGRRGVGPWWRGGDGFPMDLGPEPRRAVIVVDVEPGTASWLWTWGFGQAVANAGAVVLLWVFLMRNRRSEAHIRRLEEERRRRQELARIGEMAAVLAHEIRNPLAVAKGHLQLLAEGIEMLRDSTTKGSQWLSRVKRSLDEVGRIERLVQGLLDYARERRPNLEKVRASELVALADEQAQSGAEVINPRDPEVLGDREELARAFANILRNGREAAGPEGRVCVTISEEGNEVVFVVEDSGPGVPEEIAPRVFEPFVTQKVQGVGLGLAIAQKVIEAHHGRVALTGRGELGGARFEVRLAAAGKK